MNIILDTNIIARDYLMKSESFLRLINYSFKTGSTIVFPSVVAEELKNLYSIHVHEYVNLSNKGIDKLNSLLINSSITLIKGLEIEELSNQYLKYARDKLSLYCLDEPEFKDEYLKEVVRRAIQKVKPMSPKGEEFRDCLLWLTIIDYLKTQLFGESTFISSNVRDFANISTGTLHSDLEQELSNLGLCLKYYTSLEDFLSNEVSQFDFITKEWLIEHIDWDMLDESSLKAVNAIHCGFFYQYLSNINKDDFSYTWELLSAKFDRNIDYFFVDRKASETFVLELLLPGKTEINFEAESGEILFKYVGFGTRISITIFQKKITDYQNEYYEEETGLALYE